MKITMIHDNVLVKVKEHEIEEKTASGLLLSNAGKSDQMLRKSEGQVISIGEGRRCADGTLIKPSIKEGDKVIYNKFAGTELIVEDIKYLIIKENDIVAIID